MSAFSHGETKDLWNKKHRAQSKCSESHGNSVILLSGGPVYLLGTLVLEDRGIHNPFFSS